MLLRRSVLVLVPVLVPGLACEKLLGLDPVSSIRGDAAGSSDARPRPGDALPDASDCVDQQTLTPIADTTLDQSASGIVFGSSDVLEVSNTQNLLLVFAVNPYKIKGAVLTLSPVKLARGCDVSGASCAGCASNAGGVQVYWTRVDWNEAQATWMQAAAGIGWDGPGATGSADRHSTPVSGTYDGSGAMTFNLGVYSNDLEGGWGSAAFGIEVTTAQSTMNGAFASRENDGSCGSAAPPSLYVTCK